MKINLSLIAAIVALSVLMLVCAVADGYLTYFVFKECGIRLTGFETAILTAAELATITITFTLVEITAFLSRIAKSLEKKNAETKSSEDSDEQGDE